MADNVVLNPGVGGATIATDDVGGVQHELVKIEFGSDGVATMVDATNPLPVSVIGGIIVGSEVEIKNDAGNPVPVSVAALPLPAGAATAANQQTDALTDAQIRASPLPVSNTYLSNQAGTWGYNSGVSGTVTLTGGKRVLKITAIALELAGSFTINGGDVIVIPYGATDKVSSSIEFEPMGNVINPTIIFTNTKAYMVEWVS